MWHSPRLANARLPGVMLMLPTQPTGRPAAAQPQGAHVGRRSESSSVILRLFSNSAELVGGLLEQHKLSPANGSASSGGGTGADASLAALGCRIMYRLAHYADGLYRNVLVGWRLLVGTVTRAAAPAVLQPREGLEPCLPATGFHRWVTAVACCVPSKWVLASYHGVGKRW